jgi:hypothetical protein
VARRDKGSDKVLASSECLVCWHGIGWLAKDCFKLVGRVLVPGFAVGAAEWSVGPYHSERPSAELADPSCSWRLGFQ